MREYEILLEMVSKVDGVLEDLFCSGFCSVPEYAKKSLSVLKEEAADYRMVNYEQKIAALSERLEQKRHSIKQNGAEVMDAYAELHHFNRQLKQRLLRDKLKQEMLSSSISTGQ